MSRDYYDVSVSPYTRIDGLMEYLCCGRNTAMRIGIDSGAKRKIGRRVVYDLRKVDSYIQSLDSCDSAPTDNVSDIDNMIAEVKKARAEHNSQRDSLSDRRSK